MYGVFVLGETDWVERMGLGDCKIYLFGDENDAEDFQLACLLKAGEVVPHGFGYRLSEEAAAESDADVVPIGETASRSQIIEYWQAGLGAIEFFHAYEIGPRHTHQEVVRMLRAAKKEATR